MAEQSADTSMSRRLFWLLALPVMMLVADGLVLGLQIARMNESAHWVDHTDATLAKLYEVQKRILDQETGLRGFLVTDNALFLEPYLAANVRQALGELSALTSDNPSQVRLLLELQSRYELWIKDADPVAQGHLPYETARSLDSMRLHKQRMDQIRQVILEMLETERHLKDERQQRLHESNRTTGFVFAVLLGATALVISLFSRRSVSAIAQTFQASLVQEKSSRQSLEREEWIRSGQMKFLAAIQGALDVSEIGHRGLQQLVSHTGATVGTLFVAEGGGFRRRAGLGVDAGSGTEQFAAGEGLIGRAALEATVIEVRDIPSGYLMIRSGLGVTTPRQILFAPAILDGEVLGVVELGFLSAPTERVRELLMRIGEPLATAIRAAESRSRLKSLLEESQQQSEELQTQGEELRVANEELSEQSKALQETKQRLEERQRELESTNASLESQTEDLQRAQRELKEKSSEVERASRYKSEFLANMSHELRTPLNSALILAKLLADNKPGNLNDEQVRFAQTIYSSGNDLLTLINDILDLSKIEAGKVEVHLESTTIRRITQPILRSFEGVAKEKRLQLSFSAEAGMLEAIRTDVQRVQQILKNLLSNALKFTDHGTVTLRVEGEADEVRFIVRDTGIGIPTSQHELIFEAFRQADGTTNRKYGGTGLGLSISRDLAHLLGGDLTVQSEPGCGSAFTLLLPREYDAAQPLKKAPEPRAVSTPAQVSPPAANATRVPLLSFPPKVSSSTDSPKVSQRLLLIVEDDAPFVRILIDLAHELEFEPLVATTADEAMRLSAKYVPSAVILDMNLPDYSGLSVLDRLKRDPRTRHVPVHVVSVADLSQQALAMGAAGYLHKPVKREDLIEALRSIEQRFTRRVRRLLVVEDEEVQRQSLHALLGGEDVELVAVGTVAEALSALRARTFDCVVTDLMLPDASGDDLLERMAEDQTSPFPPVIVYTGRLLSEADEQRLRRHSSSIIVKGARSPERLLDEVTLFLHQVESDMPPERQRLLKQARDREKLFEGRRILLAEDDVRNIFALSSILEPKGAKMLVARNGCEALSLLEKEPKVDLVLMDIMMPEMDGLTAMREIRKRPQFAKLPIIALTAKAMRDDQERCLQAGANDYVAKPLDVEMLLSLLRVWMPK